MINSVFSTILCLSLCVALCSITSCKSESSGSAPTAKEYPKEIKSVAKEPTTTQIESGDKSVLKGVDEQASKVAIGDKPATNQKNQQNSAPISTPSDKAESKPKKTKPKARRNIKKPQIEFAVIRHDFGTIIQGDTVDYNFEFVNNGKGPLVIESAKATCGCTQPSYPFIPIESGEKGYIGVKYISVGKEGTQKPLITVTSNASKEPITLLLTGKVDVPTKDKDLDKASEKDTTQNQPIQQDSLSKDN